MRLSNATLNQLDDAIDLPRYDRSALKPGIVHIGVGNFHRAHQSWYLHRLMQAGLAHDWAIIGAGVRPYDMTMRDKLLAQDCLTTLIELDPSKVSAEIVGSMIDYVPVEEGNGPLIAAMSDSRIRIVSLTVTEGGYFIDPASKDFDADHPDIQHDIANPLRPRTAFGAIVAALGQRRAKAAGPFAVQSCDNLEGNGAVVKQTVLSLARLSDPELARWIEETCTFPNSMVDCIVPATGPNEISLARKLGLDDAVPVTHENFREWVIEDDFCAGRPALDQAGAIFSDDVHGYEAMKIRILNAGHQFIANAGELLSIEDVSDCMEHATLRRFFDKVQHEEVLPHVRPVPGRTPSRYLELVARRFSNTAVGDTTRRIAFDGSSRHTGFVLPTIRDGLSSAAPVEGLALVEALWARMCEGTREDGSAIEPNDPYWDDLVSAAKTARERPRAWLEQSQYYGDLVDAEPFANAFDRWLQAIWSQGSVAAIERYTAG
ncbi:mannitol dehydrogenase family protein [Bauldia sp.]|uniref:mannitol dehydrogenase family protein n=1 Tax=Bauldia sp. TaxID=2575872 RepID=UPI003BAD00E2